MNATTSRIIFDPVLPTGAIVLLGVILAVTTILVYRRVSSRLTPAQSTSLLIFRLLGLALLLVLLLQPSREEKIPPAATQRVTFVAVDDSRSMAQSDVEQGTRVQAAKMLLEESELVTRSGMPANQGVRLFRFGPEATPITSSTLLSAEGATTRFHSSLQGMLSSLRSNERATALILLSDGHDLEMVNPAKTGFTARSRQVPIFAVPLGRQGKVRDVAVRITSFQPYCYVKQKARISAALRPIGCELEILQVDLVRAGKVVQTLQVPIAEEPEVPVNFEVIEPEVGQVEYEVRVRPVEQELETANNQAITYLNVIDQQLRILVMEGEPYWDTAFLQRSLVRNDKMNVNIIVQYAAGKARVIRTKEEDTEPKVPQTPEEWSRYDVIVLGRHLEQMMSAGQLAQLTEFVRDGGGTVIFSRGPAFEGELAKNELEPVIWDDVPQEHVRLQIAREGQTLAPFRTLNEQGGLDSLPQLIAGRGVSEKRPLAATLASAQTINGGEPLPGFVHRRFGEGQVLSIGVDGLWRWAFNAKTEGVNTVFDRFWDQMLLWLMAGRDFVPTERFAIRASSANIPLGEKIYFRAIMREAVPGLKEVPLVLMQNGQEVARTTLTARDEKAPDKLTAEFLPAKTGKYEAVAQFPDGSKSTARFIAFEENLEQTEVATDVNYLRKLCESSGGRLLKPEELGKIVAELKDEPSEAAPTTRLRTIWDQAWVFWAIGLIFGADWYLRRRWGLC